MKVLVVGQGGAFNLEAFVSKAFRQLGWDVRRLDMYQEISSFRRFNAYTRMLATRSYALHALLDMLARIENRIVSLVELERPELLLVIKGEVFPPNAARKIRHVSGASTALWFPDDPRYLHSLLFHIAPSFEHVIVSSPPTIPLLREIDVDSVVHLPFACDPTFHRTLRLERTYDVTFVGSYYPERRRLLSVLKHQELRIWGPYWDLPWASRSLRSKVMKERANGDKLIEIMNRSKISVNIHHKTDLEVKGKLNMRTFETAGCGSFQLVDHRDEIGAFFAPGKEIVCYDSPEELSELVDYFLASPKERIPIAEAGQRRAYADHTYVKRVSMFLQRIGLAQS